ncbi:non sense mediated decay [Hyphodiscus hymeniophilus]|uniref:Non sense mediated decay n=1 Tax=Hyphodiscus hymeniophilus TaxID=353542 RepID=A0A9P6VEF8_9HELO|nr:non sense mediated decay [Hyphodiscus hymeniophilus]
MGSISEPSNASFPIIDVSQISSPEHQPQIARQITEACSTWGFLLLKNHPIPTSSVNHVFDLGHQFFSLPSSKKDPYPITPRSIGYIGPLADAKKDDKASMWFGGPPGSLDQYGLDLPPFWHDHVEEIQDFKHKCHSLVLHLLVCFALAMELPDKDFFASKHLEDNSRGNALRLLHYPSRDTSPREGGTRMGTHTDSGSVTLLFQRSAGLEVKSPSGSWVQTPCLEDTILVNLGDALAFWSGRKLRATPHRVTFETLPSGKERQSMAYFCAANPETVLEPLGGEEESVAYEANGMVIERGITVGEYGKRIMESIYGSKMKEENTKKAIEV